MATTGTLQTTVERHRFRERFALPVRAKLRSQIPWERVDDVLRLVLDTAMAQLRPNIENNPSALAHHVRNVCDEIARRYLR